MESLNNDSNQWEQSKENIQPLKQGRKANVLSVVLDDSSTQKLNIMRHEFEEELRTYSGDDPLDVWYRYVLWVEQNYPKGGKEGKLSRLIEKCLMALYSDSELREKYINDERFLYIWIKYANVQPNPLEVYQTMEAKNICLSLADFYINWAWEMEKTGNYKRADAIFEKGLKAAAKPHSNLEESHKKFQIRVSRSTIEGLMSGEEEGNVLEQERVALSALKSRGLKAPINRSGAALAGPAGRLSQDLSSRTNAGSSFSIFTDTSKKEDSSNGGSDHHRKLELGASINRENIRKPSEWNKAKMRNRHDVVPVEDVDKYHAPKFSVHEDEYTSQQRESQATLSAASHVLSQHKEEYDSWHVQLFVPEPFDPKAQPQYCKHKVYCGTEEFSFEELRAAQFTKKERERKQKENELEQMREMLKKQEEMIQKLLMHQTKENPSIPKKTNEVIFQDSWLTINKSVNASINASNLHDSKYASSSKYDAQAPINRGKESMSNNPVSAVVNSGTQEQGNLSNSANSRGVSFTDPTSDATNIIDGLWSCTLSSSLSQPSADSGGNGFPEAASNENSAATPIYEDNSNKSQNHFGRKPVTSFPIFTDNDTQNKRTETFGAQALKEKPVEEIPRASKFNVDIESEPPSFIAENYSEIQDENIPPPGTVQPHKDTRQFTGILQPSKDIPILQNNEELIDNEENKEEKVEEDQTNDISVKNKDLEDIVPLDGKQLEDFTIKMPTNESMFSHLATVASTPVPWSHTGRAPLSLSTKNDVTLSTYTDKSFPQIQEETNNMPMKSNSQVNAMPPPSKTKTINHTDITTTTTLPYTEHEDGLSIILEASRECRSSSSSSGCSTISNTLHGHSVHGLSQPGNFSLPRIRHRTPIEEEMKHESIRTVQAGDFTKSGYLADKSRGESLAESQSHPYAVASAHQLQSEDPLMGFTGTTSLMMKDFNSLLSPTNIEEEKIDDCTANINPFDEDVIDQILSKLEVPVHKRGGYVRLQKGLPCLKAGTEVTLGNEIFHINKQCGEGAYAKVYKGMTVDPLNVTIMASNNDDDNEEQVILKAQKPACPWEFYICHELRQRLKASRYPESILNSVMKADRGYFCTDGSIIVSKYHKYGTLLDVINGYRVINQPMPEEIALFFMVDILSILEALHSCNIIHADIKPDNFLLQDISEHKLTCDIFEEGPVCLKLIDFGRSIDMKAFPQETTFTEVVSTEKFTCCEMRDGRPWTYQTDYFGAAAIAHLFLFGDYMDLKKLDNGKWNITKTFKRYWKCNLWENFFSTLLNVPSCSSLPNLSNMKKEIITIFSKEGMYKDFNFKLKSLYNTILSYK